MDFFKLLEKRRTIRTFEDKEVPTELLLEIINDSIKAPNGGNRQPWSFVVVNDRAMIKRISDESKKHILDEIAENPDFYMKRYENALKNDEFNVFYNAPTLILIVGRENEASTTVDTGLLASYMMLSATSRGLGTCWVGLGSRIKDKDLRAELGLTDDLDIIAPIIIGYPESIPPIPKRKEPNILKILD